MNRSMSLPQPGGSLPEGYGSPSGVVRMSPQGHINANHAPVYGAPQPAVMVEETVVEEESEDLNGLFDKGKKRREDKRTAAQSPRQLPPQGVDPQGYSYLQYPDNSVVVRSGPDSVGQQYPPNSGVAQQLASSYGNHPAYRSGAGVQAFQDLATGLLSAFQPSDQSAPPMPGPAKKSNTLLYVGIGVGVVALIGTVVAVAARKRGK